MDALLKKYLNNLTLLDGYIPFAKEVWSIGTSLTDHMEKLKAQLPEDKRAKWATDFYMITSTLSSFSQDDMYANISNEILAGKAFNKKTNLGNPADVIKKYKKELDEEFKKRKNTK